MGIRIAVEWFHDAEVTRSRARAADAMLDLLEQHIAQAQRNHATLEQVKARALALLGER